MSGSEAGVRRPKGRLAQAEWDRCRPARSRGALATIATTMLVVTVGCESGREAREETSREATRLSVVCTTGMVAELVRNVGGPLVEVHTLMGEGVDPHLYKVSPGDVRALIRGDAVFYSGHHLEGKMGEVFRRLGRRKTTVPVAEGIDESRLIDLGAGRPDPHLWFDVGLWSTGVGVVRDALVELDPVNKEIYIENASAYLVDLWALDEECRVAIRSIPKERRMLVTAHDAFAYFGRAYGVEVRGIQGISTESEAGVSDVNALVELLVNRDIPAVFVESSVGDRNVRALVEGCAARGHALRIGGSLYSDAMGQTGTPEGTYIGMVRHNVRTIVEALR